jgi:uncharacterized protein YbcI
MEASGPGGAELEQAREQIAREILRIHEESYGVGAERVMVHILDDVVLVLVDAELTVSERTLLDAEKHEIVRAMRRGFQEAIAATFTAVVERATGRRVMSFLSEMSVDPAYSVELFRLEAADTRATDG